MANSWSKLLQVPQTKVLTASQPTTKAVVPVPAGNKPSANTPFMKVNHTVGSAPWNAQVPGGVDRAAAWRAENAANAGGGTINAGPKPVYQAPSSAAQLYSQYSNLLGDFTGVADEFAATGPQSITGLSQDYFNQQRDMLKERLRQDFFGPLGTLQQTASGESAAGRLGSGVGQRVIEEAAINPYMRSQQEYDTQFAGLYQQEQARVQEFNAEQMNSYQDRLAQLRANDQGVKVQLQDLVMRSADAEAGRLSNQAIAQLETDLRVWEAATEAELKRRELILQEQQNAIQYIGTPIEDNKSTQGQRDTANTLSGIFK